jgi:membrane peptidoglycan carboxypeptidase
MRDVDVATMSIGQGIAVTPLQLLTALAAIANDGLLLKPHIIKEIHNADDSIASVSATTPVRQVIAPEMAKIMTTMMEKEVSEGGGVKAAVKGYRFAGKTGTAEKLKESGGGYEDNHYISSFTGFGPVENPQVVALIVIDDPVGTYYGAEIVAPIFSEIMLQVMRYLNVHPELVSQVAPPVSAKKVELAPPASPVIKDVPQGKVVVPNVKGKTIREAAEILTKAGLAFVPVGTGLAVSQKSEANSIVSSGAEITVTFEQ